jgi:hypothetical protein
MFFILSFILFNFFLFSLRLIVPTCLSLFPISLTYPSFLFLSYSLLLRFRFIAKLYNFYLSPIMIKLIQFKKMRKGRKYRWLRNIWKLHNWRVFSIEWSHLSHTNNVSKRWRILRILWNTRVHCCVQKIPPFALMLNEISPIDIYSVSVISISISASFCSEVFHFSSHVCHMIHRFCPPCFDHPDNIRRGVQTVKLNILQIELSSCLFVSPPDILLISCHRVFSVCLLRSLTETKS